MRWNKGTWFIQLTHRRTKRIDLKIYFQCLIDGFLQLIDMILNDLGLNEESSKMEILRATRGRLAADTYSFEQPLRREKDGKLHSSFFVHGMRHQKLPDDWFTWVCEGNSVKLIQEPTNPYDVNTVAVYTQDDKKLGYVPNFYSQAIFSLLEKGLAYSVRITYLNEKSHAHW